MEIWESKNTLDIFQKSNVVHRRNYSCVPYNIRSCGRQEGFVTHILNDSLVILKNSDVYKNLFYSEDETK